MRFSLIYRTWAFQIVDAVGPWVEQTGLPFWDGARGSGISLGLVSGPARLFFKPYQNQRPLGEYSTDESSIPVSQSQAYIASPTIVNDASWFLDSRATHHVTSTTDSMNPNSEYSGTGKLALGDGSKLPITHIGHITLPTSRSLHLKNVLMVPFITKNLISIYLLLYQGQTIAENYAPRSA